MADLVLTEDSDVNDEENVDSSKYLDEIEYFGTKEMRWYQIAARNQAISALERGIMRILIVLPTGAGKTVTIASSLSDTRVRKVLGIVGDRKLVVLFAAHKHRLLTQAEKTFADSNNVELIPFSIFSEIPKDLVWDITVNDESQHEACASFQYHLEKLGNKPVIGLTATPDRADGMVIKFQEIIEPISREEAVEQGYLAPTFINSIVDAPALHKGQVTKMVIDNFGSEFGQTMMFFRTKKEVAEITQYLTDKGYKAVAILNQSEKELDKILDQFSNGEHQFIVNCNKINEGVDVKGCTDVYLGRAYGSYPQLNQVIGRAARPDSPCIVWELINPLSGRNLDTTVVVGTPERHRLISKKRGSWITQEFDYVGNVGGNMNQPSKQEQIIR